MVIRKVSYIFKTTSFVFNKRKNQVCKNLRVSKWWQDFNFWVKYRFNSLDFCFVWHKMFIYDFRPVLQRNVFQNLCSLLFVELKYTMKFDGHWFLFVYICTKTSFWIICHFKTRLGWLNGRSLNFWIKYPCKFLLPRSSCTGCWIEHQSWQISFAFLRFWKPDRGYVSDWLGFGLFWCSNELYVWNVFFHVSQKWRNTCLHSGSVCSYTTDRLI